MPLIVEWNIFQLSKTIRFTFNRVAVNFRLKAKFLNALYRNRLFMQNSWFDLSTIRKYRKNFSLIKFQCRPISSEWLIEFLGNVHASSELSNFNSSASWTKRKFIIDQNWTFLMFGVGSNSVSVRSPLIILPAWCEASNSYVNSGCEMSEIQRGNEKQSTKCATQNLIIFAICILCKSAERCAPFCIWYQPADLHRERPQQTSFLCAKDYKPSRILSNWEIFPQSFA